MVIFFRWFGVFMARMKSEVNENLCVSCGCCIKVCPKMQLKLKMEYVQSSIMIHVLDVVNVYWNVLLPLLRVNLQKEKIRSDLKNGMIIFGFLQ